MGARACRFGPVPLIKVRGVAAGDATADNARVIAEGAARVAAFR